jgi:hypothetical protein
VADGFELGGHVAQRARAPGKGTARKSLGAWTAYGDDSLLRRSGRRSLSCLVLR